MSTTNLTVTSHSLAETKQIGFILGKLLQDGDIVCLQGNLGSGKTSLTQGIGQAMQISDVINSPTFVFIREHAPTTGNLYLYHVDLYRIDDPDDIMSLGLVDYLYGDGVTVIEWAERALAYLPSDRLWITIHIGDDDTREFHFQAHGTHYEKIVQALQQNLGTAKMKL